MVSVVIFIIFCVTVVFLGMIVWYFQSHTMQAQNHIEMEPRSALEMTDTDMYPRDYAFSAVETTTSTFLYDSATYGLRVPLLPGWESAEVTEEIFEGDDPIAEINFYLPSQYGTDENMPDYVHVFTISVHDTKKWEESTHTKDFNPLMGEVIGNNTHYTFVYTHLNGDVLDITPQTMQNMEKMIDAVEIFTPMQPHF